MSFAILLILLVVYVSLVRVEPRAAAPVAARAPVAAAPALLVVWPDLRLGGVIIEDGKPRALIAVAQHPMAAVGPGDALGEGMVVEAIAFDRVVLRKGAQTRTVGFPVAAAAAPTAPVLDEEAREAIARVAFAEAANQGDAGLAGVVYTILNRLADGRWGRTVEAVVNAPGQFEPVGKAGGDWRGLPPVDAARRARIDTILNLAKDGHLPDLTHGARYFQNPGVVAERARAGVVSPSLVDFGGAEPSRVIGAHSFYTEMRAR